MSIDFATLATTQWGGCLLVMGLIFVVALIPLIGREVRSSKDRVFFLFLFY